VGGDAREPETAGDATRWNVQIRTRRGQGRGGAGDLGSSRVRRERTGGGARSPSFDLHLMVKNGCDGLKFYVRWKLINIITRD
jgi:hypothetical protein